MSEIKLEDEIDALFKLEPPEFTVARNALALRLKKSGDRNSAERVKSLSKPSISAWAVNQLYWRHQEAFARLMAEGARFGRAHAAQMSGKQVDMRARLAARREALTELSRLADRLLREAGHDPTSDVTRRIATSLEALSVYASLSDGPRAGRLTADVHPPGLESLSALAPVVVERTGVVPFERSRSVDRNTNLKEAKAAVRTAELAVRENRGRAAAAAESMKKAAAQAKEAERVLRDAGRIAQEARSRLQTATAERASAAQALQEAEHSLEKARKELARFQSGL